MIGRKQWRKIVRDVADDMRLEAIQTIKEHDRLI